MGAYAMPSDRPFRTSKGIKIKTKREKSVLDKNAALLREHKVKLNICNGVATLTKVDS